MLTTPERIVFIVMAAVFGAATLFGFYRMYRILRRGRSYPLPEKLPIKAVVALLDIGLQKPMFKARPILSAFHALIFFGFSYYLLVNVNDLLEGFIPGYSTAEVSSFPLGILNLTADVLSVGVLVGVIAFLVRRLAAKDKRLKFNENVLLNPEVARGAVKRDSLIVAGFILMHVGARFSGQAFRLALMGETNPMQPFASLYSLALRSLSASTLETGIHVTWWIGVGLIVVFLPYFIISKHVHLIAAPLNLILQRDAPRGLLDPAAPPSNGTVHVAGAGTLDDLRWPQIMDSYACIMCNRCNDVCPAHSTGQTLSPAALEVNKRYFLNQNFMPISAGNGFSPPPLIGSVISADAVWACTTCYACVRVCPVGNEPMLDIIDMRRRMILDAPGELDSGIQTTLETIARTGNSFGKPARKRGDWAKEVGFTVKDVRSEPAEYLWFVGDYASFDPRVVPNTQLVAKVLHEAGVDFGILYAAEKNAGNDVRRVGEEGLFEMLVEDNLKALGATQFEKILTTDPHTLNTLRNEYPQYGGKWPVHHYAGLLLDLLDSGALTLNHRLDHYLATYHDPCYLGRYNGGFAAPRTIIERLGVDLREMPRNRENSFCCGAGGGQIWKGTASEGERPAENRIREALRTLEGPASNGASGKKRLFLVACPKDVVMYTDAVKSVGAEDQIEVRDIIQLIVEAMGLPIAQASTEAETEIPA